MLKERLLTDIIRAMKAKDTVGLTVIRGLLAELKNEEIKRKSPCDQTTEMTILMREVGKYREVLQFAQQSKRADVIDSALFELEAIQKYVPEQYTEDEVREMICSLVTAAPSPSFGSIMKEIAPKIKGKFDMKKVTDLVKQVMEENV